MSIEVLKTKIPSNVRNAGVLVRAILGVALSAGLVGCARNGAATEKPQQPAANADTANSAVLATIGDEKITLADVRGRLGERLDQVEAQYRRTHDKMLGAALDSIVRERLIADESKKRGKSPDELLATELVSGLEPSEVDIADWFKNNQARLGGRSLDQVRSQIADLIRNDRRKEASQKLEQRLRDEHNVTVNFEPYRIQFVNEGAPSLGKKDAPVTLVEFSDFQCPYCQAFAPTLKQVEQKFGDKVQIVYRQFPISNLHPFAFKAAEASLCAQEQGKFWQLHDLMFQDQKKLAVSDLKKSAGRLGMDQKKFDRCLDSGRYVEQVQNDQREAVRIGVTGTPALFINGISVDGGSVPFSVLETEIEKQLARSKSKT